jgi:hypothetical protein
LLRSGSGRPASPGGKGRLSPAAGWSPKGPAPEAPCREAARARAQRGPSCYTQSSAIRYRQRRLSGWLFSSA